MIIENKKVVAVNYSLTSRTGLALEEKLIESTINKDPFVFLFGSGGLIAGFESNLRGKKAGETFDFYIQPKEAYGEIEKEWIIDLPVDSFRNANGEIDLAMLQIGNTVPMTDNKGNQLQGTVKNIADKTVTMDFNHPLAGQELHFSGQVLTIREATAEELSHGHVHGPGGHHH